MHVFKALSGAPDASIAPHTARWYKHIQSYANEFVTLPGTSKAGETLTTSAAAPAAAAAEEDDEVDLFGSDDEVDEEAERIKAERVAAYAAKKAVKPKTIAKVCVIFLRFVFFPLNTFTFTVCRHPRGQTMGRRDRYESVGSLCAISLDGWPRVGRKQTCAHRLWYQQTPDYTRCWYVSYSDISMSSSHASTEDELVSLEELQEKIAEFEDYVQSSDVAAMQSRRAGCFFALNTYLISLRRAVSCGCGHGNLRHVVSGCVRMVVTLKG